MKVLLVHPEDTACAGPWAAMKWDLIVDLAHASQFSAAQWSEQTGSLVLRLDSFRKGIPDIQQVQQLFAAGRGVLVDRYGLDWWDIVSLYFVAQTETVLALQRLCIELKNVDELWATRLGWPASCLSSLLGRPVRSFPRSTFKRISARLAHYSKLVRRFSAVQLGEIVLDKYDAGFRHRARIQRAPEPTQSPVVLVPTAYENVSRGAAAYAALVPEQKFLFVHTRRSGTLVNLPANVTARHLSSYGSREVSGEAAELLKKWLALETQLSDVPPYKALRDAGVFNDFPNWITDGLSFRDAWANVLDREPVCSVLCGDDSNSYTRVPMLLAAARGIPTLDFHHGALDGFYLIKGLDCDLYLAKSEMERDYLTRICGQPQEQIALAAPGRGRTPAAMDRADADAIVFFSEPYETLGDRGRDIYAELLPGLAHLARQQQKRVIIKLHPFETVADRRNLLRAVLPKDDQSLFALLAGPLTPGLLAQAWIGVTVSSSVVVECTLHQIPCFVCEWLAHPSFGYVQQFARFGLGLPLHNAAEIQEIPIRVARLSAAPDMLAFWSPADPDELSRWFSGKLPQSHPAVGKAG